MRDRPFLIECQHYPDSRGGFLKVPLAFGSPEQVNFASNDKLGTVRGFHRQDPSLVPDLKVVTVLLGRILDVCVKVNGLGQVTEICEFELDAERKEALVVPENWFHGYQTLEKGTLVSYVHYGQYLPEAAQRYSPLSHHSLIKWPLPISSISQDDRNAREFTQV